MTVTVWPARENLQSFLALWRFEQGQQSIPRSDARLGDGLVLLQCLCAPQIRYLTTAAGLRGQLNADARHDCLDRLHEIKIPTLTKR
jgi:hypothetical protein